MGVFTDEAEVHKYIGGVFEKGVASLATTSFSDYYIGASPKTVAPPESALTADNMAKCLNGYSLSVGSDGRTGHSRLFQRGYAGEVVKMGETVWWRRADERGERFT